MGKEKGQDVEKELEKVEEKGKCESLIKEGLGGKEGQVGWLNQIQSRLGFAFFQKIRS